MTLADAIDDDVRDDALERRTRGYERLCVSVGETDFGDKFYATPISIIRGSFKKGVGGDLRASNLSLAKVVELTNYAPWSVRFEPPDINNRRLERNGGRYYSFLGREGPGIERSLGRGRPIPRLWMIEMSN